MTGKPRITMAAPTSAGFESASRAALPFDPASVSVSNLEDLLAGLEDVDVIHGLQRADERTTAAAHYERRINEIQDEEA